MIERVTYTTQPSAQSMGRYITVYAPDGSYVSRHINMEECTESALAHAQANEISGTYRFVPPEKHMSVQIIKTVPGVYTGSFIASPLPGRVNASGLAARFNNSNPGPGDLYDLSGLVNNVFEVTWPTAPTTSSTVNVSNSSELESAISGSAVRIVMAPGTYSGATLSFGGNDIDVVAGDNVDVLYTQVNLLSRQRIRITGGNWGAPGSPMRWSMRGSSGNGLTDVLWDDFNFYGRIETLGGAPGGETTAARRLAIINSTFDGDAANEYGLDGTFFFVFNNPAQFEDVTFANVKMDNASGGNYVNRMHGIQRLLVLDSAFNMKPSYPGTVAGLRMGEETNGYHIQDTLIGNRIFGSLQSPGDLQQFGNGWFENVSRYTRGSDTVWSTWQNENPPNDGTVNNCTTYHDGATVGVPFSLGTSLSTGPGGNNLIQSYSVLPDVSAYGAQR